MTNKDYERLTFQHSRHGGMICGVGLKANSEEVAERLYALEEMIENGTLAFLPCKVGDEFWWIFQASNPFIVEEKVQSIEIGERGITIIDMGDEEWSLSRLYFTKEAADKALEELKNVKRCTH